MDKKQKSVMQRRYKEQAIPALMQEFQYGNVMQVPRLSKIVINACLKEAAQDKKILDKTAEEIGRIVGQKPVITRAKKAISNFKLRANQPIGCMVTLREERMFEFLNRLINVALPRVRDFKGVSPKGFDGRGNYTLGLTEQTIFPEINIDSVERVYGMSVIIVTSAKTDKEGRSLLKVLGMPFREK